LAHSIEGRTPFSDHHFTECVNLPPSLKIRISNASEESCEPEKAPLESVGKYILSESA
jgi:hypothetical protein